MAGIARIALIGTAASLAACGSGAASTADSGVRGRALIAPTCPVERYPPDPRCKPKPLATKIAVLKASDRKRVATTSSGKDGRFSVRVSPGRYYLRGAKNGRPFARPVLVTVHAHRFARVTLTFDSGIR
jgi:hypothetical protein